MQNQAIVVNGKSIPLLPPDHRTNAPARAQSAPSARTAAKPNSPTSRQQRRVRSQGSRTCPWTVLTLVHRPADGRRCDPDLLVRSSPCSTSKARETDSPLCRGPRAMLKMILDREHPVLRPRSHASELTVSSSCDRSHGRNLVTHSLLLSSSLSTVSHTDTTSAGSPTTATPSCARSRSPTRQPRA